MTKAQQVEQQEAISRLRELLKPGDTVHTILRSVSRSGMTRHISTVIQGADGPNDITWLVKRALDYKMADDGGLKVTGAGMDMGFAVVYDLSRVLFRNGFACIGERCHSNDHSNGDRDYTVGKMHTGDGGYALSQRWL